MDILTWAADGPAEEGYYWMRFVIDERRSAPRVLRVLRLEGGLHVQLGTSYEPVAWWGSDNDVEWAGPIQPPPPRNRDRGREVGDPEGLGHIRVRRALHAPPRPRPPPRRRPRPRPPAAARPPGHAGAGPPDPPHLPAPAVAPRRARRGVTCRWQWGAVSKAHPPPVSKTEDGHFSTLTRQPRA